MTRLQLIEEVHDAACMYAFWRQSRYHLQHQPGERCVACHNAAFYRMGIETFAAMLRATHRFTWKLEWGPGA